MGLEDISVEYKYDFGSLNKVTLHAPDYEIVIDGAHKDRFAGFLPVPVEVVLQENDSPRHRYFFIKSENLRIHSFDGKLDNDISRLQQYTPALMQVAKRFTETEGKDLIVAVLQALEK